MTRAHMSPGLSFYFSHFHPATSVFFITADMNITVIVTAIDELVYESRIAVESKDHRFIFGEEDVIFRIGQSVRVAADPGVTLRGELFQLRDQAHDRNLVGQEVVFDPLPVHDLRPGLCFAVSSNHSRDQIRIVKHSAECMGDAISELAALIDGAGCFRRAMAGHAAREADKVDVDSGLPDRYNER